MTTLLLLMLLQAAPAGVAPLPGDKATVQTPNIPPPVRAHVEIGLTDDVQKGLSQLAVQFSGTDEDTRKTIQAIFDSAMLGSMSDLFIELVKKNDKKIDAILNAHKVAVYDRDGTKIFPRSK
jgi:hypothetical protein